MTCPWPKTELDTRYHDQEWGVPSADERHLFEMLILEGAQAGLSWSTILKKREGYREAFDGFVPHRVAAFTPERVARLLADPRIVRNRLKVAAAITNARAVLRLHEQGNSLAELLWSFPDPSGKRRPIVNDWTHMTQVPASTPVSDAMSKALIKLGFKFVGSTICYALMQAVGMVNDHLVSCPRRRACMGVVVKVG